jgi:hypothetical protein
MQFPIAEKQKRFIKAILFRSRRSWPWFAEGARLAADSFSAFAAPGACTSNPIALYRFSFMRLMTVV